MPEGGVVIGYVLKMFPRFSETFILAEILELERRGVKLEIVSLRKPDDGCFHAELARLRSRVHYLPEHATCHPMRFLAAHFSSARRRPRSYLAALGLALQCLPLGWPAFLRAPLIAQRFEPTAIGQLHAHFASLPALAALLAARLLGIQFSFTAHAKDIFHRACRPRILKALIRHAVQVITISDFNIRHLARLDPAALRSHKLVRIYNGIDLRRFSPPQRLEPSDPASILAIGRLVEKKGFGDLIEALGQVQRRGLQFHCQIIGKGPLEPELERAIDQNRLRSHVSLEGPLARGAIAARLRRASMLVVPSVVGRDGNREGLPTVLLEAMACAVPAVATTVTGIPEAIEDGVHGRLVPPGDPTRLAEAIGALLADAALRHRLGRAARQRAEQRFDLGRNVAELLKLWKPKAPARAQRADGDRAWPALAGRSEVGVGR
ncbi:MAG TPA: glycosyltransferase [Acidobacteriota bacterium]